MQEGAEPALQCMEVVSEGEIISIGVVMSLGAACHDAVTDPDMVQYTFADYARFLLDADPSGLRLLVKSMDKRQCFFIQRPKSSISSSIFRDLSHAKNMAFKPGG